jgi:ABC-type multidrug transport system fused ATPase/permease subunit
MMKDGFIIEIGTHDQLMSVNGDYANLVNTFYAQQQHSQGIG